MMLHCRWIWSPWLSISRCLQWICKFQCPQILFRDCIAGRNTLCTVDLKTVTLHIWSEHQMEHQMETVPTLHKAKSTFPLHKAHTRSSRLWQSTFLPRNRHTWPRSMRPKLWSAFRCRIRRMLMSALAVWSRCLLHMARRQTRLCCPRLP
jgi:hypothetical protein